MSNQEIKVGDWVRETFFKNVEDRDISNFAEEIQNYYVFVVEELDKQGKSFENITLEDVKALYESVNEKKNTSPTTTANPKNVVDTGVQKERLDVQKNYMMIMAVAIILLGFVVFKNISKIILGGFVVVVLLIFFKDRKLMTKSFKEQWDKGVSKVK